MSSHLKFITFIVTILIVGFRKHINDSLVIEDFVTKFGHGSFESKLVKLLNGKTEKTFSVFPFSFSVFRFSFSVFLFASSFTLILNTYFERNVNFFAH